MSKKDDTEWGAIRVSRLEVTGLDKDTRDRWKVVCETVQEITNFLWQEWLAWHIANGSRKILKDWLAEYRNYKSLPKAERPNAKPKPSVSEIPKEFGDSIYKRVTEEFPQIGTHIISVILNEWRGLVKNRKSANGNLSGWINILVNRESIPSAIHPVPVPFNNQDSGLVPPMDKDGNYKMWVKLWRIPAEEGQRSGTMVKDEFEMWTKGRKRMSQAKILRSVVAGEYKFCGSKIHFKNGKVYVLFCYRQPIEKTNMNPDLVAFAKPSKWHPVMLRIGNRRRKPGGYGNAVGSIRRKVMLQRRERQNCYRVAGSSNKGHGRERALQGVVKLSNRWKDFVKAWNHTVTTDIVDQCVEGGFGTLVWFKPSDVERDNLFLSKAGKSEQREASSWDYYQIESMLQYKCERVGITLVVRGASGGVASESRKSLADKKPKRVTSKKREKQTAVSAAK